VNKKRVIQAIKILQEEVPGYVEEAIMGDCPCDLGLPAKFRKWCGMEPTMGDVKDEFTPEFCERCWAEALGENDG